MKRALQNIDEENNADFFFLYFTGLDQIGHTKTYCSTPYEEYLGTLDEYIGILLQKLNSKNLLESTYVILTSDHGAVPGERQHGKQNDSNLYVPFYVLGPEIKKGFNIDGVHNMDTAPTILKMLGLEKTKEKYWRGRVLEEIFEKSFRQEEKTLRFLK